MLRQLTLEVSGAKFTIHVAAVSYYADPERFYDEVVEIDLSELAPHVVGPHTPDLARPVARMAQDAKENDYPLNLTAALIGSCTNSSYEDMSRARGRRSEASPGAKGAKAKHHALGHARLGTGAARRSSATVRYSDLEAIGGIIALANACGPCIGQWKRETTSRSRR